METVWTVLRSFISRIILKLQELFTDFQQSCWEVPLNVINAHTETILKHVSKPFNFTKALNASRTAPLQLLSSVHSS